MADNNVSVLNDLIEVSRDGEEGFRKAAEDAKNPELKTLFSSRAEMARGRASCRPRSRHWAASRKTTAAWPARCIAAGSACAPRCRIARSGHPRGNRKGEDVAKKKYAEALQETDLSFDIRALIERQYQGVLRNHDLIRDLRNRYRASGE
jgi:hypothetical protein